MLDLVRCGAGVGCGLATVDGFLLPERHQSVMVVGFAGQPKTLSHPPVGGLGVRLLLHAEVERRGQPVLHALLDRLAQCGFVPGLLAARGFRLGLQPGGFLVRTPKQTSKVT
ncbi:hypothetical protein [Streptomyces lavendulocolor]|uniref:hypothetical protein n=1 Tax=Streptomyces lavendulocolor TaxID=67316 RepID=UPI003C2C0298